MTDSWLDIPEGTILALQRRRKTGELDQWAVAADVDGFTVRRSRPDNGKSWQVIQAEVRFIDLNDVLKRVPELRILGRGTISEYTVDSTVLEPPVFVSLLEIPPGEGSETAGQWLPEVAAEWIDSDSELQDWQTGLNWIPRWARVNDFRISAIDIGILQPVLVDEGEGQLVPIREIARSIWHSESGGAPISWSGGNTLSMLAPGLGYNQPWEDSAEVDDYVYRFRDLPETPAELGEALAEWVIETHSQVAAALTLEPLDPRGLLEDAERREWYEGLATVTLSFKINVDDGAQRSLRDNLVRKSELYRRTRDALARPYDQDGQALAAALDHALDTGVVGRLTSGDWVQKP